MQHALLQERVPDVVVREELAAAPGSSGVSSRDGLEEGSDDDTQE
ncbi:hypothetical protein ABID62_009103, partial [Bradyrhizobium sp. S3.9.1]